jgi:hypothetical protein
MENDALDILKRLVELRRFKTVNTYSNGSWMMDSAKTAYETDKKHLWAIAEMEVNKDSGHAKGPFPEDAWLCLNCMQKARIRFSDDHVTCLNCGDSKPLGEEYPPSLRVRVGINQYKNMPISQFVRDHVVPWINNCSDLLSGVKHRVGDVEYHLVFTVGDGEGKFLCFSENSSALYHWVGNVDFASEFMRDMEARAIVGWLRKVGFPKAFVNSFRKPK